MSFSYKSEDRGYSKTLDIIRKLGLQLELGVFGPKAEAEHLDKDGQGQGITVGEIAEIHELGLGVPERSWLRAWFEQNHTMVLTDLRAGLARVVTRQITMDQLAEAMGQKYVGQIQDRIANGIPPPLAESTIARKGSSTPLIDTGQLRSAISYLVKWAHGRESKEG